MSQSLVTGLVKVILYELIINTWSFSFLADFV